MTTTQNIVTTLKTNRAAMAQFGIRDIGLFGSYVRGEQSKNSDIDILLDFEPDKETYDNYMAVYDLLEQLFKNEKVEIVTKNGLSPYIGTKILNEILYV
jgi:predicted nucleotidyltransferase